MPMPESSVDEIRSSTLRYLRMYEEGSFTLSDLSSELAVMAPRTTMPWAELPMDLENCFPQPTNSAASQRRMPPSPVRNWSRQ